MSPSYHNDILRLAQNGAALTLQVVTPGVGGYNPSTGVLAASSSSNHNLRGIVTTYLEKNGNNSMVMNSYRKVMIPAISILGIIPKQNDIIIQDGKSLVITQVQTIQNTGFNLAYLCQVKI
jgi:hypothetical protein